MKTPSFKKSLFLSLSLLFILSCTPSQAQDTERGGGDTVVLDFRTIQRDVLLNINGWRAKGLLKISDLENEQLLETVKILKVFSEDHVFLQDESNGEPQGEEVDAVNYKYANPPKIVLGRVRWKQKTSALEKETLVLHELLSVSKIKDSAFERSYLMKLKTTEAWLNFKSEHRTYLHQMQELNTEAAFATPSALLAYYKFTQNTSEYKTCMASENESHEAQITACSELMSLLMKSSDPSIMNALNSELIHIQEKAKTLNTQYLQWTKSQPEAWATISLKLTNEFLIDSVEYSFKITKKILKADYSVNYGSADVGMVQMLKNQYDLIENRTLAKQNAMAKYTSIQLQKLVEKLDAELSEKAL